MVRLGTGIATIFFGSCHCARAKIQKKIRIDLVANARRKPNHSDAPYRETRQQLDQYGEEGVLAVEMQAASLFALAQVRHAQIAVVAHVSNATDHEGEPFNRGSKDEGVQILTAICNAAWMVA